MSAAPRNRSLQLLSLVENLPLIGAERTPVAAIMATQAVELSLHQADLLTGAEGRLAAYFEANRVSIDRLLKRVVPDDGMAHASEAARRITALQHELGEVRKELAQVNARTTTAERESTHSLADQQRANAAHQREQEAHDNAEHERAAAAALAAHGNAQAAAAATLRAQQADEAARMAAARDATARAAAAVHSAAAVAAAAAATREADDAARDNAQAAALAAEEAAALAAQQAAAQQPPPASVGSTQKGEWANTMTNLVDGQLSNAAKPLPAAINEVVGNVRAFSTWAAMASALKIAATYAGTRFAATPSDTDKVGAHKRLFASWYDLYKIAKAAVGKRATPAPFDAILRVVVYADYLTVSFTGAQKDANAWFATGFTASGGGPFTHHTAFGLQKTAASMQSWWQDGGALDAAVEAAGVAKEDPKNYGGGGSSIHPSFVATMTTTLATDS